MGVDQPMPNPRVLHQTLNYGEGTIFEMPTQLFSRVDGRIGVDAVLAKRGADIGAGVQRFGQVGRALSSKSFDVLGTACVKRKQKPRELAPLNVV